MFEYLVWLYDERHNECVDRLSNTVFAFICCLFIHSFPAKHLLLLLLLFLQEHLKLDFFFVRIVIQELCGIYCSSASICFLQTFISLHKTHLFTTKQDLRNGRETELDYLKQHARTLDMSFQMQFASVWYRLKHFTLNKVSSNQNETLLNNNNKTFSSCSNIFMIWCLKLCHSVDFSLNIQSDIFDIFDIIASFSWLHIMCLYKWMFDFFSSKDFQTLNKLSTERQMNKWMNV